jgi:hypothetical protein
MLLPYFFDVIPEKLGRLYAKSFNWHPEGKRILLRVAEGEAGFYGTVVSGRIIHVEDTIKGPIFPNAAGTSALIQLDSLWQYENRTTSSTSFVVAIPRFYWHGVYRLLIASADVHIFPAEGPKWPSALVWQDMIAICSMKLIR